jgi:hypothetical protein
MHLCVSRQPEKGASLTLPYSFTEPHNCAWRQTQAKIHKLQYDVITLVGLHPQGIGFIVDRLVGRYRAQVHDFTLNRRARGVGPETIDLNANPVCLALQDACHYPINRDNCAVDRTDNPQWGGGKQAPWIAKQQVQRHKKQAATHRKYDIQIAHRGNAGCGRE